MVIYLFLFMYTILLLIKIGKDMTVGFWEKVAVLFLNPIFLIMWFPIYIIGYLTRKKATWGKTERVPFAQVES